jgi:hypothetical protein
MKIAMRVYFVMAMVMGIVQLKAAFADLKIIYQAAQNSVVKTTTACR